MILVPLEHRGVVIHVLYLDAKTEIRRESATVQRAYHEAVPLLSLVIQSTGEIELTETTIDAKEIVAVLRECVADRCARCRIWIGSVSYVDR